jgi:hypothetical protein
MTTVDWKRDLQAVHDDGRVFAAAVSMHRLDGNRCVVWHVDGLRHEGAFTPPGEPVAAWSFHIRNTPAAEQRTDTATLPPELQQRMVALVRAIAAQNPYEHATHAVVRKARAIVADPGFPVEVDDLDDEAANEIIAQFEIAPDDDVIHRAVVAALRRGKQMAGEA